MVYTIAHLFLYQLIYLLFSCWESFRHWLVRILLLCLKLRIVETWHQSLWISVNVHVWRSFGRESIIAKSRSFSIMTLLFIGFRGVSKFWLFLKIPMVSHVMDDFSGIILDIAWVLISTERLHCSILLTYLLLFLRVLVEAHFCINDQLHFNISAFLSLKFLWKYWDFTLDLFLVKVKQHIFIIHYSFIFRL